MPRPISQLPISIACMCIMHYMVNSASAPLWKIKKASMSFQKEMWNNFTHVQTGQAEVCSWDKLQLN